jgi:hypothetical protein
MTIDRATVSAFLALCVLVPFGCDPDNDGRFEVDERDAEVGWTAMNHAAAGAHDDFSANVELATEGDVELECEGGGSLLVTGRMNAADDFQLDFDYDGCVDDDVVIDGSVSLVASVEVDVDIDGDAGDHAAASVVVDYDGQLTFDGAVEGSCTIDASIRAGAVVFEDFAAAGVEAEGHVCDHDASVVITGEAHGD